MSGKTKEMARYHIDALLYGRSPKGYYMFEVSTPVKGTQKNNIGTFENIKIPKLSKLKQLKGFDSNKMYIILQANQVEKPTIWKKLARDRIDNNYIFFYWDPSEEHELVRYFWRHPPCPSDSKEDLPTEFNIQYLQKALNKFFGDLSHDDIVDLCHNLNDEQISELHDVLGPEHQANLLASFLSDEDVKMLQKPSPASYPLPKQPKAPTISKEAEKEELPEKEEEKGKEHLEPEPTKTPPSEKKQGYHHNKIQSLNKNEVKLLYQ